MKKVFKIIGAIIHYLIVPIIITVSFFQFLITLPVYFLKSLSSKILIEMIAYLCILASSVYFFIKMNKMSRADERLELKKALGVFILFIGTLFVGFGLWMLGLTIYHDILKAPHAGVIYYRSIFYGLVSIGIGLIPLSFGIILLRSSKNSADADIKR